MGDYQLGTKVEFRFETLEEQLARQGREAAQTEAAKNDPDFRRYDSRVRPHCLCGRFAKPGHDYGRDFQGEYNWTVICKEHGEVWMN